MSLPASWGFLFAALLIVRLCRATAARGRRVLSDETIGGPRGLAENHLD